MSLTFGNALTRDVGSWWNQATNIVAYRTFAGMPPNWGYCAGQGPYDDNDGTVYYSGTIGSVSTTGGQLVITDSGSPGWSTNQWFTNGNPYSFVDTSVTVAGIGSPGHPGYEISSNTSNAVTTYDSDYSSDYWNGPPTITTGDSYQILRASLCVDQPSRGIGNLVSGAGPTPTGWVAEILDPTYELMDTGVVNQGAVTTDTAKLIANRDWYTDNQAGHQTSASSPFNGASGMGWGTLANRPTSCTPSVAYWATDQGSWNQSGNSFGQGELFVCTATNTWTVDYTPYTYPHPLTQPAGPILPPTGVQAVAH